MIDGHDLPWMNANVIFPVFEEGNWKCSKIRVETCRCSGSFSWMDFEGRNRIEFKNLFRILLGGNIVGIEISRRRLIDSSCICEPIKIGLNRCEYMLNMLKFSRNNSAF